MAETTLGIKVDSSQAKTGAAEVRAELAQIKALFADVIGLSDALADRVGASFTNASAKVIAAQERSAAAAVSASAKIEAAQISAAARIESASITANAKLAAAADARASKEVEAAERASRASQKNTKAVETEADQMARLKAMVSASAAEYEKSYSAVGRAEAASKKYAASLDEAHAKAATGKGTFSSLSDALNSYSAGTNKAGSESTKAGAAFTGMAGGFRNGTFVVQQAGYQIADVAAQAANGGLSFAAMGVQLGQFLGIMGAAGAAAGAGVTVIGVLADTFIRSGDGAKKAAADVKEFTAAIDAGQVIIDRYAKALDRAAGRPDNWRAESGAIVDMQAQLDGLIIKRQQMEKDSAFFRTSNALGLAPSRDDKKELDNQIDQLRYALQLARDAAKESPAVTIGASVRPGSTDLNELKRQQEQIQTAISAAASANNGKGDEGKLKSLTDTYEALSHAIATYATESQKAELRAQATAKAATMTENEAKKYLAAENARIDAMGKATIAADRDAASKAATIQATAELTKAQVAANKQIALAAVDSNARLASSGIDAEKERISQRRALLEISAADEIALQREQDDKKRAIDLQAAQDRLSVLRSTHPEEYAQIDAAERSITELRAKQANERQKQLDAEVSARAAAARQMAQIQIDAVAQQQTAALSVKQENLSFGVSSGDVGISDAAAQERAIADERYQIEKDLLEKKLQLAGIEESERARINAQLVALENQRSLEVLKIDHKETQQRVASVKEWTQPFKSAVDQSVSAFIQGNQTMAQVANRFATSIAASYASKGIEKLFDKIAAAAVTSVAGEGAASALGLGGAAAGATAAGAQSAGDAAQAGAITANTTALNALTIALGGNTTATAADATAAGTNAAATGANTGVVGANTVATATDTTMTATSVGEQVAGLLTNTTSDGMNTGATAANTAALAANTASNGGEGFAAVFSMFAAGTRSAASGPAVVGEEGPEIMVDRSGNARLLGANGPQFVNMAGGEEIYTASATRAMFAGGRINAADGVKLSAASGVRAGAGMSLPGIVNRSQLGSMQTVNNNTSSTTNTPSIHVSFVNNGGGISDADLEKKARTIAKIVRNETRNFNPNTRR